MRVSQPVKKRTRATEPKARNVFLKLSLRTFQLGLQFVHGALGLFTQVRIVGRHGIGRTREQVPNLLRQLVGIDLTLVSRVGRLHSRFGDRFLVRAFHPAEIVRFRALPAPQQPLFLAGRWSAKEGTRRVALTRVRGCCDCRARLR